MKNGLRRSVSGRSASRILARFDHVRRPRGGDARNLTGAADGGAFTDDSKGHVADVADGQRDRRRDWQIMVVILLLTAVAGVATAFA